MTTTSSASIITLRRGAIPRDTAARSCPRFSGSILRSFGCWWAQPQIRFPKSQYGLCDHFGGGILVEAHWMNAPLGEPKLLAPRSISNKRRICYASPMDEGRKRVLLIAASILAARKLAQYDSGARVPATISAISDAVRWAAEIMTA